ncbi:heat shock protein Hsp90 [Thelephora ganbajun]|uniref:Heat shock protein Hsp90 n=1 Tax=Thelephora ganbajun TaxID=370292 RepID=A0ACB6ZNB3_THEGA|nr:heat shock protein Hsp90 [Thelephora ganbajun]
MRILFSLLLLSLTFVSAVSAQDADDTQKTKFDYQSDVTRLRKIVINSLYSHRDVWLRELISNSNDALEKFRLTSLTKKGFGNDDPLNITVKAIRDEDEKGGKIIITDTGIGMSKDELAANLGTLAKSGTTEFLNRAENADTTTGTGNLIGAFGVGFYSSFLVADRVYVASRPPRSKEIPEPEQWVFSSSSDESSFEIYPDPRGATLGQGTEITLIMKPDAVKYLSTNVLTELIDKHSAFSSTFPIYLFTQKTEEVPVEEDEPTKEPETVSEPEKENIIDLDDDEALIEDVPTEEEEKPEELVVPKTKTITVDEWVHANSHPPIWTRDPKDVTEVEYLDFYRSTFKDYRKPIGWHHFSGDAAGTSFKGIIFLPEKIEDAHWQQTGPLEQKDIRLMVKHVFITSEFGSDRLPKWASWVRVIIDADDLPLNVSRETLQSSKFIKQMKGIILRHLLILFNRLATDDLEKWALVTKHYGMIFKFGAVEDTKNRDRLINLVRFETTQRQNITLDQYVENKRKGQSQIFYMADSGKTTEQIKRSVFVEKLEARGYEVLLFTEPLDEVLVNTLRKHKKLPFQDVAKAGLKFGDEDGEEEDSKEAQKKLEEKFKPLIEWLKEETKDVVRDVVISNRLVTSACAVVAEALGYTANVERLMNAAHNQEKSEAVEFLKKLRTLEINPKSPLIEGLLARVEGLNNGEEKDAEFEKELKEVASILIDGALVRSGFQVHDSNEFFIRVDRVLRRSLGVSETARAKVDVKPAPEVDPTEPEEEVPESPQYFSDDMFSDSFMKPMVLDKDTGENIHDEL